MRYQGRLVEWNDEQGFGFIQPKDQQVADKKVFLHIKSFQRKGPRPLQGCMLEYDVGLDSKGRLNAQQVTYINKSQPQKSAKVNKKVSSSAVKPWQMWLMIGYAVFLLALVMTAQLAGWVLLVPIVMSVVTYVLYVMDKKAAKQGTWRVQESTLHITSALGGWCGALIAQQQLRHKTIKPEFRQVFWVTVTLNWMLVIGLATINIPKMF
jgi:uncharacterized membrane protein YsdA (DUF1294 family)/cold shock CspA family protein